jgi:protein-S-isoprenylcysteine O-methyltransferase Ste14
MFRVLVACLALPGVVAFALPLLLAWLLNQTTQPTFIGWVLVFTGFMALIWCTWFFYVSGKGTLAPWSPPKYLVTSGLYKYSRNPMYCAVLLLLSGWAVVFHSVAHAFYAAFVAVGFHLRVVLGEEPWLAKTHGEQWLAYSKQVGRWFSVPSRSASNDA